MNRRRMNSTDYENEARRALDNAYAGHADNQPYYLAAAQVYATLALANAVKEVSP